MLDDHIASLNGIQAEALKLIEAADSLSALDDLRVKYLGKKSALNTVMRGMKDLTPLEKPVLGKHANETKQAVQEAITRRREALENAESAGRLETETIDVTLPGEPMARGRLHPLTRIVEEMEDIFVSMGFVVEDGPDIEDDFHNFEALNIAANHPARDMHDTFYLPGDRLLRTHTSPVQIRSMRKYEPPMAVVAPGRAYRVDAIDATHSPMFHQIEGFMVDEDITFGDLKGALRHFLTRLFGMEVETRFRPSYFPFTEPSAEVDMRWKVVKEVNGEKVESEEWLEVLGSGMIHPNVLRNGGHDPEKYTGFAFGAGVERLAMLKYGINDIRLFTENDVHFLRQF